MKVVVIYGVLLLCFVCQEWLVLVIPAALVCFSVCSEYIIFLSGSHNKIYSGRFKSSVM